MSSRPRCSELTVIAVIVVLAAQLVLVGAASARPGGGDAATHAAEQASYREAVELGTTAFREGRYAVARAAFERAAAIHAEPVLLFNIASCWRRGGDPAAAVVAYRRFLDAAPLDDPRRRLATETIAALEAELAAIARQPVAAPVVVAPPPEPEPRIVVEPGEAIDDGDRFALRAAAVAPAPRRSGLRRAGIGLSAVGALVLVAGGVEALRAHALEGEVEGFRDRPWNRDEADTYRRGQATARRALIFGAGGAAVLAGGVTLFVIGRGRERAIAIEGTAGGGGGGFRVRGRF